MQVRLQRSYAELEIAREQLRRIVEDRSELERNVRFTARAAGVALWDWNLRTQRIDYSPEWKRQLCYGYAEFPNAYAEWERRLHPEDRKVTLQELRRCLGEPGREYRVEFRLRHKDGSYRSILAQGAARWNGVEAQTRFETMDLRDAVPCSLADGFDLAVTNPPYRSARSGRVSALSSAALSRHEIAGGLSDVAAAARQMLRPQGHLCVIYPASRLASLVTAVCREGIEPKVLRLVHPRSAEPASLALLRAVRGAKEGLEIRPPLFLHGHGDRYSPEAGALLGHP